MSARAKREPLAYSFAPLPTWIVRDYLAGEIGEWEFRLQLALYADADSGALAKRQPTPTRRLDKLSDRIGYPHDLGSFRKMIARQRALGRLDYSAIGSPRRGYEYAFTLRPDGPSANRPPKTAPARPPKNVPQPQSPSGIPPVEADRSSAKENAARPPARPPTSGSRPPKTEAESAANHRDSAAAASAARPPALDVLEKTNLCSKGRTALERLHQDHSLVGEETSRANESEPPLWETYDPVEAKRRARERNRAIESGTNQ